MGTGIYPRRGNAAVTAVSLAALLGFGALAVDISYIRVTNAQLQVALEAGVLGGAGYLDGTLAGFQDAVANTERFAMENTVFGGLNVGAQDVIAGRYDLETQIFEARAWPGSDEQAREINAIRLDVVHTGLNALLAGIAFGRNEHATAAVATAVRDLGGPAGSVECALPVALPSCMFPEFPGEGENQFPVVEALMSNANVDNAGWATTPDQSTNTPAVQAQLSGNCASSADVFDTMSLMNGVATPIFHHIADMINGGLENTVPWPDNVPGPPTQGVEPGAFANSLIGSGAWGTAIGGPIALVELDPPGEPGTCAGAGNFNQDRDIKGFAYAYIYDVRVQGNDKQIKIQLDFANDYKLGKKVPGQAGTIGNVEYPPVPPVLIY